MVPADPSPASPLLYQSDLAQTPLPEILVKVHRYRVPGTIECRRGDELKRIYVDRGNIIFGTTNKLSESLGDTLLRDGRITREQYEASVDRLRETGKRHGVVLVEMKVLTAEELFLAVRQHIQELVWSIFSWDFGQVTFAPGREKHSEFVKISIPIPQAVLQGVRFIADARSIVERLGTRTTVYTPTGDVVEGLGADELRLLEAVNGRRALFELVNVPPLGSSDNARILYALATLGLMEVVSPRQIKVQVKTDGGKYTG